MNGCNQDRNCHKFQVKPTEQGPLPVGNEAADVAGVLLEHEVDLEPVVGPAPELHLAVLVVEGEPGDVDGTAGLEYPGRDVGALSLMGDHYVGLCLEIIPELVPDQFLLLGILKNDKNWLNPIHSWTVAPSREY